MLAWEFSADRRAAPTEFSDGTWSAGQGSGSGRRLPGAASRPTLRSKQDGETSTHRWINGRGRWNDIARWKRWSRA